MIILFACCLFLLVHAYFLYPLSLAVLALVAGDRGRHRVSDATPAVTLVISVYNEERWIERKLENSLALDYPRALLKIVVVSDGSSDRTVALARSFEGRGVEVRALEGRRGKVACLNVVIPTLTTDLVVMSDANSMYDPQSIRRLVAHFGDERIGCVCGRLRYENPGGDRAGEAETIYWGYEGWIKTLESRAGALLGANGAIYAYRRPLFRPVNPLMFCDDVIPIRIAIAGRLAIYAPEAWCTEQTSPESVEMRRRRRHASFGLRSMLQMMGEALQRGRLLVLYECLSHRVLRWLGGLAILGILVSTPFLPPPLRTPAVMVQAVAYLIAAVGYVLDRAGFRLRPAYAVCYGIAIHAAGLAGLYNLVMRRDRPFWEPRQ